MAHPWHIILRCPRDRGQMLPDAEQVADPFHVHKLANTRLDECRRRVQNETMGHRGRKDDSLYRARRLLIRALLYAGKPNWDPPTIQPR